MPRVMLRVLSHTKVQGYQDCIIHVGNTIVRSKGTFARVRCPAGIALVELSATRGTMVIRCAAFCPGIH